MRRHVYLKNLHLRDEKKEPAARQTRKNLSEKQELRKNLIKEGRGKYVFKPIKNLIKAKSKKLPRSTMSFTSTADAMTIMLWEQNKKSGN